MTLIFVIIYFIFLIYFLLYIVYIIIVDQNPSPHYRGFREAEKQQKSQTETG